MDSTMPGAKEPNPADLIWSERLKTTFDINKMHEFIEGSESEALETLRLMQQLERDPVLNTGAAYYQLSKDEHREITARKIARMGQYMEIDAPNYSRFQNRLNLIAVVDPQLGTRIGVHLGLFLGAVRGNGTEEQFNYWAKERGALSIKGVYGCFAMTELAHGSNVAALETTATYNKQRDTFEINTPHVGATKWWIGGAAHSATHTVCYARLIVDGKDYGVKTFVVPLRDSRHVLHPGVSIGDIGAKMGRDGIDNGWIQFSHVEIPRKFMLSKYTSITDDGEVLDPPLAQLAYGALLGGRVTMVTDSFRTSERFITIALRYSVGRRQFTKKGQKTENQLINYPLHQRRLLPYLSWTYGMAIASHAIQLSYKQTLEKLDEAVESGDFQQLQQAIAFLKTLFGESAALKSTCTWTCLNLIEECRQACGGHGYSAYSGFAKGYVDHAVQCTWEGDNNILAQNSGRITVQKVMAFKKSGKASGEYEFLAKASETGDILAPDTITHLGKLVSAFDTMILRLSLDCIEALKENNDWDSIAPEKLALSKLYACRFILAKWVEKLNSLNEHNGDIVTPLVLLAQLFALSNIEAFGSQFLRFGIVSASTFKAVLEKIGILCREIRPLVIGLTDSFKMSDFFINSTLGSYNGDIYHHYYGVVKMLNEPSKIKAEYSADFEQNLHRGTVEERENFERTSQTLRKL
ncbi:hypothetical protein KL948_004857 [Ogataea haglerorum]|nr:hypothetical protein KL948_004857 [Ogataea haglerorum]